MKEEKDCDRVAQGNAIREQQWRQKIAHKVERRFELRDALATAGCQHQQLQQKDSLACEAYIHWGRGNVQDIVRTIVEVADKKDMASKRSRWFDLRWCGQV